MRCHLPGRARSRPRRAS
ncbi:hypothetical protein [Duganella sp. Leaf126]